ncbi:class I SAM-dependent methyltransferase [Nitratiruptor sp. YY09-18]|uniref:class I SAM-dependent DNA methyltransferase n=1 Tax=Nitratiruptor sp. YY09-18 TaxID=2724901 RepID=UPI0019164DCD|nr:class I SAM-dependent methyltransferase [Nitratiruptor sp. YY09-18]BCD67831.1 hypothetical protein NitYY0918_C0738 [Nitratiruptor sp. YY09-18]
MDLDLYAKVEELLGFFQERQKLYDIYIQKLLSLGVKRVLDVGCGSGVFMQEALKTGIEIEGVDLSSEMVKKAQNLGLKAQCIDVCEVDKRYEAVTAVFDVVNYLTSKELKRFFRCIQDVLEPGGYFVCDINTLFGFEEVAQGCMLVDKESACVGVDAEFDGTVLTTSIIYFYAKDGYYHKKSGVIQQYYHDIELLKNLGLKLIDIDFVTMYGEEVDKALLTFQKE